ncbi:tyrosine-type recombinase/integrase [Viridibacillus sp. NPDC096237]|uniref:tyrosine-type recombinase/integrase n=1 Tax=Viridibacillus sp. NPDC096237 TaxID=3390721 RepID=UPI003D0392BC
MQVIIRCFFVKIVSYITNWIVFAKSPGQSNGISPHKLRHSFAVDFIRNGGDIILLRDQLGHNDIKTTSLYTNMASTDSQKVLDKMELKRKNI